MGFWGLLVTLVLVTTVAAIVTGQDGRCYLNQGSSSASFTVTETMPIGGIIGVLEVAGSAGRDGDIVLSLQEGKRSQQNVIHILAETKQLVLTGKLDKEGVDGHSQLHVQVKCEKRMSNDPAILIPVRIVVQDANDNAPVFVNAPYILQLSEAMTPGMVISSNIIRAYDRDQPGPFSTIQYSVEEGEFSDHLAFQSPMGQTLVIKKQLDYETLPQFTVSIRAQDQGQPPLFNSTTLMVRVLDADDQNPRFFNQSYYAVLPKTNSPGDNLAIEPSPIKAADQDRGLNMPVVYSLDSETANSHYFYVDQTSGVVSVNSSVPPDVPFPITLVIRATQKDNLDKRDLATLTIGRNSNFNGHLRFLSPSYQLKIPENLPNDSILLRLQTNRPFDEHLQFRLKDDYGGQFGMNKNGDLLLKKPVDFEKNQKLTLEINVTSGSMSDTAKVELQMLNVNEHDPKFTNGIFRFQASSASISRNKPIGRLPAVDADRNDHVTFTLLGPNARAFTVDGDGNLFVKNVTLLNSSTTHLVAVATDDGVPPRKSSVPVEVTVPDELIAVARMFSSDNAFFLMIVFGVSLGVLFVVIVVLSVHIAKRNRQRVSQAPPALYTGHQPLAKMASYTSNPFAHQKLNGGTDSGNSPTNSDFSPASVTTFASPNVSATSGRHYFTHLDNYRVMGGEHSTVFRDSPCSVHRLVRHPSRPSNNSTGSSIDDSHSFRDSDDEVDDDLEDRFMERDGGDSTPVRAKRIFVKSKNADLSTDKRSSMKLGSEEKSIPKRVKKLSWEDEQKNKQTTEMDVDMNGMPLLIKRLSHPDTTVYF